MAWSGPAKVAISAFFAEGFVSGGGRGGACLYVSNFLNEVLDLGTQFGRQVYFFPAAFGGIANFTSNPCNAYQLEEIEVIAQLHSCPGGPARGTLDFYDFLGCDEVYSEQVFQQKVLHAMAPIAGLVKDPAFLHGLVMFFQADLTAEKPELAGTGLRIMDLEAAYPKSPKKV